MSRPSGTVPTKIMYVKVRAYVYENSSGDRSIADADISDLINRTNQHFINNAVPIRFYLDCNIVLQRNEDYYHMDDDDYNTVAGNSGTDDFEIHFVRSLFINGGGANGVATLPRQKTFGGDHEDNYCIAMASRSPQTLAHEIGHALGLAHTHDGGRSGNKSNYDCGDCYQESVSRSRTQGLGCISTVGEKKCDVNGDFFCDTPADPDLYYGNRDRVNASCVYDGTLNPDRWGAIWTPQVANIMSYNLQSGCTRTAFTPQQAIWMYINLPYFSTDNPGYSIAGSFALCSGEQATYSVPAISGATQYTWTVPSGWTVVSGQGTRTAVISGYGGGRITVIPNCGAPAVSRTIQDKRYLITGIEGPQGVTKGQYITYRALGTHISGTTYTWATHGGQIHSGQGTSSIVLYIPYSFTGGYVGVTPNYGLCTGNASLGLYDSSMYGMQSDTTTLEVASDSITRESKELVTTSGRITTAEAMFSADVTIYPNPAANEVKVVLPEAENVRIRLINLIGQVLMEKPSVERITTLQLTSIPKGSYIVEVVTSKATFTKRLIIQ